MFLTFVDNQKDNMEKTLLNIETVTEYDDMLGVETLHPQVSVIDLSKARPIHHMRHNTFSFYVVFLKDEKNCELVYGRQRYDYQKGSVVCLAPGQVIGIEDTGEEFRPQGYALCFHPDLIRGKTSDATSRNIRYPLAEFRPICTLSCLPVSHTALRGISPSLSGDISVLARRYLRLCSQISPPMVYHAPINSANGLLKAKKSFY